MRQEAKDRDIEVEWGTHFAIRTFRRCGLSEAEFENGLPPYIDDIHLPEDVVEEMKSTEKD